MKPKNEAVKEKEREEQIKAMRQDLEAQLEEQLPEEMVVENRLRVEVAKIDENEVLQPGKAKQVIEALFFASSKPLTVQEIKKVLKVLPPREIQNTIEQLKNEYEDSGRSFEIREIAGGYELSTRKQFAPWVCKIELQKRIRQASQSALETLAILAYKQPLTRAEIEDLRGVDSSAVLAGLIERGFIKIVGKKEVPGRPFLYGTTEKFLEHFGLNTLAQLPSIDEIKDVVERSVNKDQLIGGNPKVIDVPQEAQTSEDGPVPSAPQEETNGEPLEIKTESADLQPQEEKNETGAVTS